MPTYEYICRACESTHEIFQYITEGAKRKCPQCGALKLKRLIGKGSGIIFKGKGFYHTDYKINQHNDESGDS
jgi:putative FmdB family regulatory protein